MHRKVQGHSEEGYSMKTKQFIFLSEKFGQGENIKVFKPEKYLDYVVD